VRYNYNTMSGATSKMDIVDITGNILICHDSCQLQTNYDVANKLTVGNQENVLSLSFSGGNSVKYNGMSDTMQLQQFQLQRVQIIYPPIHFIKSVMNNNWLELILTHQTVDKKTTLNLAIILTPDDSKASQGTLAYKLFESIAQNIPITGNQSNVAVVEWYVKDLLPADSSFFSYTAPSDQTVGWIVFQNLVNIPTIFVDNYKRLVANPNAKVSQTPPTNPVDLVIFGYTAPSPSGAAGNAVSGSVGSATGSIKCPSITDLKKQEEAKGKQAVQAPVNNSNTQTQTGTDAGEKKAPPQVASGMSWWKIALIIIGSSIGIGILFGISYFMYKSSSLSAIGANNSTTSILSGMVKNAITTITKPFVGPAVVSNVSVNEMVNKQQEQKEGRPSNVNVKGVVNRQQGQNEGKLNKVVNRQQKQNEGKPSNVSVKRVVNKQQEQNEGGPELGPEELEEGRPEELEEGTEEETGSEPEEQPEENNSEEESQRQELLEQEKANRIAKEQQAEANRIAREQQAEANRIEMERKAEANRLAKEKRNRDERNQKIRQNNKKLSEDLIEL
jgi:carbonic anhydrase